MNIITVSHLKKYFKIFKKKVGLSQSVISLFSRPTEIVKAVDDISFSIQEGELVGFIGPNGAGKTTTLKCLSGLLYPSEGKIDVLGFNPFERKEKFLKEISLVMGQKNQLWWDLPAMETFKLNKEIYEVKEEDFKKILSELSALLEVHNLLNIPVRQLSLGQRMKMELIAALIHKPRVLFLDEPTIGLDVVMQKKIRDFIAEYNKRFQATILLTSHYMADVKKLCQRVIIINRGKVIYDGSLEKLIKTYADCKIVTFTFKKLKIEKQFLQKFGKINHFDSSKVSLSIPRKSVGEVVKALLQEFSIEDLTVEDPEIEEVIRLVFNKKE